MVDTSKQQSLLIAPYGGKLVDLLVDEQERDDGRGADPRLASSDSHRRPPTAAGPASG